MAKVKDGKIYLEDSGNVLAKVKKEQAKYIKSLYEEAAKEVEQQITKLNFKSDLSASDILKANQLEDLKKSIDKNLHDISDKINVVINENMKYVSTKTVDEVGNVFKLDGIEGLMGYVPDDVVRNIATGKVYGNDWSLSKAIWGDYQSKKDDINKVIAAGIAQNKTTLEIAEALQQYVDPNARKDWEWSKVYPTSNKVIDYSAQRLARTLVQHAYQQSLEQTIKSNPYIEEVQWKSAKIHGRTCKLCMKRDGKMYPKGQVPMDHPNGLCTLIPVLNKSLSDIGTELGEWASGKKVKNNAKLNAWAKNMGYELSVSKKTPKAQKDIIDKIISEANKSDTGVNVEIMTPNEFKDMMNYFININIEDIKTQKDFDDIKIKFYKIDGFLSALTIDEDDYNFKDFKDFFVSKNEKLKTFYNDNLDDADKKIFGYIIKGFKTDAYFAGMDTIKIETLNNMLNKVVEAAKDTDILEMDVAEQFKNKIKTISKMKNSSFDDCKKIYDAANDVFIKLEKEVLKAGNVKNVVSKSGHQFKYVMSALKSDLNELDLDIDLEFKDSSNKTAQKVLEHIKNIGKFDFVFKKAEDAAKAKGSKLSEVGEKTISSIVKYDMDIHYKKMEDAIEQVKNMDGNAIEPYYAKWRKSFNDINNLKESYEKQGKIYSRAHEIFGMLKNLQTTMKNDIRKEEFFTNEELLPIYAMYDYTHASGAFNKYKIQSIKKYYDFDEYDHPFFKYGESKLEYGKKMCDALDKAFELIEPVKEDFTVKRLVDESAIENMLRYSGLGEQFNSIADFSKAIKENKGSFIFANEGYTSTSTYSNGDWSGSVALAINVKKGTKAFYAESLSYYQQGSELETLLKADQKLRVLDVVYYDDNPEEFNEQMRKLGYSDYGKKYIFICETIPDIE